ncbi:nucleoside 2-deoxyribosyltransferase [Methanocorpusculum sp. MG]|uniref:Nucleoside 2-deoxyribosyltransferase n=1 Tax=Methanocorpusculum petauri TaxID=3002863 RepID=A0ABT4IF39_9EURY|nr:nucleoside 2-deoxyribosyltransferase [Methanocorpusculum petauri]MCZ0860191.1 nucleoside 2-deoxyribosyltransferase [Methanocorpusculum petauri]MDE2443168.1 nucleoside 2-deoxyribosyltransferase [Methanocorpusculum sp.]
MYVLVSPCILNEKLRAEGITTDADRAVWAAAAARCRQFGIEMVPLPCPETLYLGVPRSPGSFLDRLNTPEFAAVLDRLEEDVRALIAERGEGPIAILGVNSSPTCGVTTTYYGDEKSAGPGVFLKRFADIPLIDVRSFARYRIYLAAPLFSEAQKIYNAGLADLLASQYYAVHLPQKFEDTAESRSKNREELIYRWNLAALKNSDIVVAVIDGSDVDSGTAWEMGYATALGKRIIAIRTDFRRYSENELVNLMLETEAEVVGSSEELLSLLFRSFP